MVALSEKEIIIIVLSDQYCVIVEAAKVGRVQINNTVSFEINLQFFLVLKAQKISCAKILLQ